MNTIVIATSDLDKHTSIFYHLRSAFFLQTMQSLLVTFEQNALSLIISLPSDFVAIMKKFFYDFTECFRPIKRLKFRQKQLKPKKKNYIYGAHTNYQQSSYSLLFYLECCHT